MIKKRYKKLTVNSGAGQVGGGGAGVFVGGGYGLPSSTSVLNSQRSQVISGINAS